METTSRTLQTLIIRNNLCYKKVQNKNIHILFIHKHFSILTQKRDDTYFLLDFWWSKWIIFKFNIAELFSSLYCILWQLFEVAV